VAVADQQQEQHQPGRGQVHRDQQRAAAHLVGQQAAERAAEAAQR
jgi:hypothetical protein